MSVRSCLLCGRALSRWSGSGDEFCSREHRNQYRLRRSMDRLQEANQVATVMRRRENPRPLKAARLISGGVQEPRGFAEPKMSAPQPASIPQLAPACPPRMAPAGDLVAIPLTAPGGSARTVCPAPTPVRITAPAALPLRIVAPTPEPKAAPPIRGIENRVAAAQMRRKLAVGSWQSTTRPVVSGILRHIGRPHVYPMAESARGEALGTAAAAAKGRALRVSLAAGFRIPDWKLRPIVFPAPSVAGVVWPGVRPLLNQPFGAGVGAESVMTPHGLLSFPDMRIPVAPPAVLSITFRWPEGINVEIEYADFKAKHRTAFVPFTTSEDYSGKERPYEYRN